MKYHSWVPNPSTSEAKRYEQLCAAMRTQQGLLYVGRLAQRAAVLFPERTALYFQDRTITFGNLYQDICRFASYLKGQGISKGDRILLFYQNSIEFYVAYFAVLHRGAIIAPLNVYLTANELRHIVSDANPRAIIVGSTCQARIDENIRCQVIDYKALQESLKGPEAEKADIVDRDPEQVAIILYTSGTTGLPKGVMLSSRNSMTNIAQALARLNFATNGADRVLGILPLFHSFAQISSIWVPFFIGCGVIVVPKIDRRALLYNIRHKPTFFVGVPALYGLLCLLKTVPLDSVRLFVCGGDALPDKIRMGFALLYGRKIAVGYGLTEASPLISCAITERILSANNVGKPVRGLRVSIRDSHGLSMPEGNVGELWVRGNNVMLGYYNDRQQTDAVLVKGWLNTGDLAFLDNKGLIYLAGRSKELIIHKGFNIYPAEVENVLIGHPLVLNAAVVGYPLNGEEVPVAFVQVKAESAHLEEELSRRCAENLAFYKTPRKYHISTALLPTTTTGKVNKTALIMLLKKIK